MPPKRATVSHNTSDLLSKLESSKIAAETKELFKLLVALFTSLQSDKESKLVALTSKINSLELQTDQLTEKCDELYSDNTELKNKISALSEKTEAQGYVNGTLEEKLADVENKIENSIPALEARISLLDNNISKLNTTISQLKSSHQKHVNKLATDLDVQEQYSRLETLVISGSNLPVAGAAVDCKEQVRDLFRQQCQLNLSATDISIAHRVGRIKPNVPDRRNIVFRVSRRDLVSDIFSACRNLKPQFYVNVSLTRTRGKILFALRQLKSRYPTIINKCRSYYGDVIAFTPTTNAGRGQKNVINSRDDLVAFARDVLDFNIDELQINW